MTTRKQRKKVNASRMRQESKPKTDAELIDAFSHGIEEGRYTSVLMQSLNFVIFRVKGHSAWSGNYMPREYVKAQHILRRKGDWWMSDKPERRWEGRVSKDTLKEALRRSEISKEAYKGDLNVPMCEECNIEMCYGEGYEGDKLVAYYRCDKCGWSVNV